MPAGPVFAAATGDDAGPLVVTGLAWELAGRTSMAFTNGLPTGTADSGGGTAWARALASTLRGEVGRHADVAALGDRGDLPVTTFEIRQVAGQLPVLADRLATAVEPPSNPVLDTPIGRRLRPDVRRDTGSGPTAGAAGPAGAARPRWPQDARGT